MLFFSYVYIFPTKAHPPCMYSKLLTLFITLDFLACTFQKHKIEVLQVHKREKFFVSDFEFFYNFIVS